jgi:signal transduction histidine kinase
MTFTHSIRLKFILFVLAILAVLLLLLNTYPITSSRDTVFQEKQSSLSSQITVVSSALGSLDRLSQNGVNDVLRFLDLSGFDRIVVVDERGSVVFDDGQDAPDLQDLQTALTGKSVFRSVFADAAFSSSIAVPVGSRGAMIGAVSLSEVDTERAAIILSIQNRIVFLSLSIGLAALLLAAAFSWIVLRRFYSLARSMHTVAGGNYAYRHEITGNDEISELEREFNTLTECLEENEKQRRRFVSDASHELKTPLASIRLMSDSILNTRQMDPDTMREFVSDIRTASDRLQRTTEKLLDLSRLDDGIRLIPEPVDLKQITLDVLPGLRALAADRGVAVNAAHSSNSGQYYNAYYSGQIPAHASGLDYVPFDGYIAMLHRGERIQTAAEASLARMYGMQTPGFDYGTMGSAMWANAPKMGGDVYLDGRTVGQVISAAQGRSYRNLQRSGWQS